VDKEIDMASLRKTRIDLSGKTRQTVVATLQQNMVEVLDLSLQCKQAHWNVAGPHFIALHELFDRLHLAIVPFIDDTAERITALGGIAQGTARTIAHRSSLKEFPLERGDGTSFVAALADRFAALAKSTRAAIDHCANTGDADSADLLTGLSRELDKSLWLLEAHMD
jgi:starvation-inducible DNA-binding protein